MNIAKRAANVIYDENGKLEDDDMWYEKQVFVMDMLADLDALDVQVPLYDWTERGWA